MSKFTKRNLFTGLVIAVSLVPSLSSINPIVAEASNTTNPQTTSINSEDTYSMTYEQLISIVDSNIEIVDNKIVVTDEDLIQNFISNNVLNLQDQKGEYKTAQNIYNDILTNINNINEVAQSDSFTLQSDGSIIETPVLELSFEEFGVLSDRGGGGRTNIGRGNQSSVHWWGYRITTFNVTGTRDLSTVFANSTIALGVMTATFGMSPAAALAAFPLINGARTGMIVNSLNNAINTGRAGRGVRLDMHRGLPTYTVTPHSS